MSAARKPLRRSQKPAPCRSGTGSHGPTASRSTAASVPGNGHRPYVCGHCAVGNHEGCIKSVPVGANIKTGPTRCHCPNREHKLGQQELAVEYGKAS